VVGAGDLGNVLRRLVAEARAATGARYAALGVIGEHGVLTDFIHEGLSAEQAERIGSLPIGRGVLGTLVREKSTIRLDSISDHPDSYGFPPNHPPMSTFLGVPVLVGAQAFGNIYLTEKEGGFTEDDEMIVEALSRIAGSAVARARMEERLSSIALVEDRERIARDLHDSVIQDLFAVGLGLQGISERVDDPTAGATLDDAVDRLDRAVEALRSYIFELRSNRVRRQLDERLQELISRMGSAYPVAVTLEIDASGLEDEEIEEEVVKIVTEALSNAFRHSGASRIEVEVLAAQGSCTILVRDDGTGFDQGAISPGMGLANLTARARAHGGSARIISEIGSGTTIEVTLPVS
jgi:signal transduction histidine kinase